MPQYGWHININNCIACRACEAACKQEFMLPKGVRRRFVITQEGASGGRPYKRHVTMGCMHCAKPACVSACPVGRYWKDDASNAELRKAFGMSGNAETGLVLIKPTKAEDPVNGVDCLGCKRCVAACPYGAARFDQANEAVDKCTGCYHRLYNLGLPAERRKPACALTCPALTLHFDELAKIDAGAFGPVSVNTGAPSGAADIADPTTTQPSVRFTPQKNIP